MCFRVRKRVVPLISNMAQNPETKNPEMKNPEKKNQEFTRYNSIFRIIFPGFFDSGFCDNIKNSIELLMKMFFIQIAFLTVEIRCIELDNSFDIANQYRIGQTIFINLCTKLTMFFVQ